MSDAPEAASGRSPMEIELYFLIAKFLASGPCRKSAEVLSKELVQHKLLPKRIDWEGLEHFRSFENLLETNRHIAPDHLLRICQRIVPLLNRDVRASVAGVMSLVGAGRQSLLRTEQDVKFIRWSTTTHVALHHGEPLKPPSNLAHPPNIVHVACSRQLTGRSRVDHMVPHHVYTHTTQLSRSLGHLSAVYCVTFDRTGDYIITGADDNLVKVWSAVNGRLLVTLRGHAAEITDIACSYNNTLLAAGSCDKLIRIWCLQTSEPVAVLHGHTHMVTSVRFCPYARGETRYLASTGGDGCLCVWEYNVVTSRFNPKPIKFIERSRAGTQMLCSSFSPGGVFLATGSSDNVIRVFCLSGIVPEKICELEAHLDRIDTIQYANNDARFISSSKDGTARVWRFERQEWRAIIFNAALRLPEEGVREEEPQRAIKYQVTMAAWSTDDLYVVTAVNDHTLKVWDSYTGQLCRVLKGHDDEVFVLEHNPADARILLSAGHDGNIIVWDIVVGTKIKVFYNMIEGQGHGAVFDCKWSPDGQSFAATDSHGFLLYFGLGSNDRYKKLPEEVFFHTDYRPLIRDASHYVLDEQTQHPPHSMPPPFLVDIDGNPYPPRYQRLVPGREDTPHDAQLVPLVAVTPSGDREVLDDVHGALRQDIEAVAPVDNPPPDAIANGLEPINGLGGGEDRPINGGLAEERPIIDEMIARMQQVQDERLAAEGGRPPPLPASPRAPAPPAEVGGLRRSRRSRDARLERIEEEREGRRGSERGSSSRQGGSSARQGAEAGPSGREAGPSGGRSGLGGRQGGEAGPSGRHGEAEVSPVGARVREYRGEVEGGSQQGVMPLNMSVWSRRVLVRELSQSLCAAADSWRQAMAEEEMKSFIHQRKLKPLPRSENDTSDSGSCIKTRATGAHKVRKYGAGRCSARVEETGRNRLLTRALYDTETEPGSTGTTDIEDEIEMEDSLGLTDMDDQPSEQTNSERAPASSSDGESSVYSDWVPDGGDTLQPPKRQSQRQVKRKRWSSNERSDQSAASSEGEGEGDGSGGDERWKVQAKKKKAAPPSSRQPSPKSPVKRKVTRRQKQQRKVLHDNETAEIRELPPQFRPPEWLTSAVPRKAPYFPQMGDEVIYFLQGHQQYAEAVAQRGAYHIDKGKNQPWHKMVLREQELLKVVGIKYEIRPPRLVCLKLAFIDPETSRINGGTFTIKFHDMPDVIDFVVLRQTYETAMNRNWKTGDRFRCLIDDTWWFGRIERLEPLQEEYPDSQFQCIHVLWDNSEHERMSPWDLEPIEGKSRVPQTRGSSVPVVQSELGTLSYTPRACEWPACGRAPECDRIVRGLEQVMELSVAEPFLVPVDLNVFPLYAMIIEYPVDLSTIKQRLENRFYRRVAAIQYDVRQIEANARAFNQPNSSIVKYAKLVTELCLRFISDETCTDVMPIYTRLTKDASFSLAGLTRRGEAEGGSGGEDSDGEEAERLGEGTSHGGSGTSLTRKKMLLRSSRGGGRGSVAGGDDEWKQACQQVLEVVLDSSDSTPFVTPVNLAECPNYLEVVEDPMDLETVQHSLREDRYSSPAEFCRDMRLIFNNSRLYNTNKRSKIFAMTLRLSSLFEEQMKGVKVKDHHQQLQGDRKRRLRNYNSSKKPDERARDESSRAVAVGSLQRFRRPRLGFGARFAESNHAPVPNSAPSASGSVSFHAGSSSRGASSAFGAPVSSRSGLRVSLGESRTAAQSLETRSASSRSFVLVSGSSRLASRHTASRRFPETAAASDDDLHPSRARPLPDYSPIKSRRIKTRSKGARSVAPSRAHDDDDGGSNSDATECEVSPEEQEEVEEEDNSDVDFKVYVRRPTGRSGGLRREGHRSSGSRRSQPRSKSLTNGHSSLRQRGQRGYNTRCATGSIKRKHYDLDDLDADLELDREPDPREVKRRRRAGGSEEEGEEGIGARRRGGRGSETRKGGNRWSKPDAASDDDESPLDVRHKKPPNGRRAVAKSSPPSDHHSATSSPSSRSSSASSSSPDDDATSEENSEAEVAAGDTEDYSERSGPTTSKRRAGGKSRSAKGSWVNGGRRQMTERSFLSSGGRKRRSSGAGEEEGGAEEWCGREERLERRARTSRCDERRSVPVYGTRNQGRRTVLYQEDSEPDPAPDPAPTPDPRRYHGNDPDIDQSGMSSRGRLRRPCLRN